MTSNIDRITSLLERFNTLHTTKRDRHLNQMAVFLSTFAATHQELRHAQQTDFNIFSLLKVGKDELIQTRFLAWLLDAESSHGQGNLFLSTFVEQNSFPITLESLVQPYCVQTNFSGTHAKLDLVLYRRGEFLIVIDNNLVDQEGIHQVEREFLEMRRLGLGQNIPLARQIAIFLTPEGRSPVSGGTENWHNIAYREIAQGFAEIVPKITDSKLKLILLDWIEVVSNL